MIKVYNKTLYNHFRNGNKDDIDAAGSLHEFLTNLHNAFGPVASFWMGGELTVSIASPKLFKQHEIMFDRPRKSSSSITGLVQCHSLISRTK
jgi:hypothetical protein